MTAIEETQLVDQGLRKHGRFDILNYKLKRPEIQELFDELSDEGETGFSPDVSRRHEGD